jgi:hypothetical protein
MTRRTNLPYHSHLVSVSVHLSESVDQRQRVSLHLIAAILGNVATMDRLVPARSWLLLWKQYGEIYQLNLLGPSV